MVGILKVINTKYLSLISKSPMFIKSLLFLFINTPIIIFTFNYLINQDFRLVQYDSEPDYIYNGLHILESKIPISVHHPGTVSYYLMSIFLKLSDIINLSIYQTIYLIRLIFISALGFFIFYFNRNAKINLYLYFSVILLVPHLNVFLGTISAEIILLIVSIISVQFLKKENPNIYQYGIVLAIGVSVKLSFILIFPIVLMHMISKSGKVKLFLVLIISLIIIQLPSLPGFLLLIQQVAFNDILVRFWLLIDSVYLILLITFPGVSIMIFKYRRYLINLIKLKTQHISFIYSLSLLVYSIFVSLSGSWIFIRHPVALIPFLIELGFTNRIKIKDYQVLILNLIFFCALNFYPNDSIDYRTRTEFDQFVDNHKDKTIFTLMDGIFHSEYVFKEWGIYRYGNSNDLWNLNWASKENLQFLNTRNLGCQSINQYKMNNIYQKWKLNKRNHERRYYRYCINDQIKSIIDGKAILTTFKSSFTKGQYSLDLNNNIEQLKEIMNTKGYRIDQKQNYDTFIVWDIE